MIPVNRILSGVLCFSLCLGCLVGSVGGVQAKPARGTSAIPIVRETDADEEGEQLELQATELADLTAEEMLEKVGPLCTADMRESGILASVTLAQFILESGYGKSELAQVANNCFGMKANLSGNSWDGSAWDGVSIYTKQTSEQRADGSYENIIADFRRYSCVEESIADHSAYLLAAMSGNDMRYGGLSGCTDYRQAFQILKNGGYATSHDYVDNLCAVVEKWNLTRFDGEEEEILGAEESGAGE